MNDTAIPSELRAAIAAREKKRAALTEAKAALKAVADELRTCQQRVDEIQSELLSGSSGRPLIDRVGTMQVGPPPKPKPQEIDRKSAAAGERGEPDDPQMNNGWMEIRVADILSAGGWYGRELAAVTMAMTVNGIITWGSLARSLRDGFAIGDLELEDAHAERRLAKAIMDFFRLNNLIDKPYPHGVLEQSLVDSGIAEAAGPASLSPPSAAEGAAIHDRIVAIANGAPYGPPAGQAAEKPAGQRRRKAVTG